MVTFHFKILELYQAVTFSFPARLRPPRPASVTPSLVPVRTCTLSRPASVALVPDRLRLSDRPASVTLSLFPARLRPSSRPAPAPCPGQPPSVPRPSLWHELAKVVQSADRFFMQSYFENVSDSGFFIHANRKIIPQNGYLHTISSVNH